MKKHTNILVLSIVGLALATFSGCSKSDSAPVYGASGTLVDPYIVGAVMCEDVNKNGTCDTGEQVSTASDSNGVYRFSGVLTTGSNIIIKTQGKHEGVTYDVALSSVVSSSSSAGTTSPLTTLNTKGLTTTQIAAILMQAKTDAITAGATNLSSFNITAADITTDPLSGSLMSQTISQITDAELSKIQASITTYALLKIMNGSTTLNALSSTALYTSATTGGEVSRIAIKVLTAVSDALNKTLLTSIAGQITTARSTAVTAGLPSSAATTAFPDVTTGLIVKVAVKVVDRLATVGYTACNANSGGDSAKVTDALAAVNTEAATLNSSKITKMGKMLYGVINRSTLSAYSTAITSADADLGAGVNSTAATFNFSAGGTIQ